MGKEAEMAEKFWEAPRSDRTIMPGIADIEEGHAQPMTAIADSDRNDGPLWFFTAKDVDLVKQLGRDPRRESQDKVAEVDLAGSGVP